MGLFVVNTVAPGGEEHIIPEKYLNKSYHNLEKIIRAAYAKPADYFDLHIHYEDKCTESNDVPPCSFNTFMELNAIFSEYNARMEYYVCFIPKANNPPPRLLATPISEQQHFSPLPVVGSVEQDVSRNQETMASNHEYHLENDVEAEASSRLRRAATAVVLPRNSAQLPHPEQEASPLPLGRASAFGRFRQISSRIPLILPATRRPLASEENIQGQRKRARTIATHLLPGTARENGVSNIVEPALPQPVASSLEHTRKKLPEISILPVLDGFSGSAAKPIVLEPEHLDPVIEEKAYKFFSTHRLPFPYRHRFEVGIINKQMVPRKWNFGENSRMSKVAVQLDSGPHVSHYCMKEDEDGRDLTPPTLHQIRLDMVSYWPRVQALYDKDRLRIFFSRWYASLMSDVEFADAQPVIADLKGDVSKMVTLHIPSDSLARNTPRADTCDNCRKAGELCEPWDENDYRGCKRCKTRCELCSLSPIPNEDGRARFRAARANVFSYDEGDGSSQSAAATEPGSMADRSQDEMPIPLRPSHQPQASEASPVNVRETHSQPTDPIDDSGLEVEEYRELYGVTPPRSHAPPNLTSAEIPEQRNMPAPVQIPDTTEEQEQDYRQLHQQYQQLRQQSSPEPSRQTGTAGRIVQLKIRFRDCIKTQDDSQPLDFDIASIPALANWTISELIDKLLRERINNCIMQTPSEQRQTRQHLVDVDNAGLKIWLKIPGLHPLFEVEIWDFEESEFSSESRWLKEEEEAAVVVNGYTIELAVEMHYVAPVDHSSVEVIL